MKEVRGGTSRCGNYEHGFFDFLTRESWKKHIIEQQEKTVVDQDEQEDWHDEKTKDDSFDVEPPHIGGTQGKNTKNQLNN